MKLLLVTSVLLVCHMVAHVLAGKEVEGWAYSLEDLPLDIHPVHPQGRVLVIPELDPKLNTGMSFTSGVDPVRTRLVVLSGPEANEQQEIRKTAKELLLEVQRERELKEKNC